MLLNSQYSVPKSSLGREKEGMASEAKKHLDGRWRIWVYTETVSVSS